MIYDTKELQEIGKYIREQRGDHPQSWLAKEVDTKTSAISYIEKGIRPVPRNKIGAFAKALKIEPSRLIPTKVAVDNVRQSIKDLEDMGIGFRDLQSLPEEARKKLVDYYAELKEKYKNGDFGASQKDPEKLAASVLDNCGIKSAPVDLTKILEKSKIDLEESSTIFADGVIVYSKSQKWAGIKYRSGMSEGRVRFTIAHELGHLFLENVDGFETSCSLDGENKNKENERQADEFASHLLLPKDWVRDSMGKTIKGIESVLKISREFEVSQTAAAIRLVQLSELPCAVICSKGKLILWGNASRKLYVKIKKGQKISRATQAYKLLKGKDGVKPAKTKAEHWFSTSVSGSFMEHSALIYKDMVLSLVWAK